MIAFFTIWVKTIIFAVLFATFLEFLLPNSNMQRFVKVIMGLFIMLTVLNPIVELVHNGWQANHVTAIAGNTSDYSAISQANQKLEQDRDGLVLEVYKMDIAKQAQALISAIDGVASSKVVVFLGDGDKKDKGPRKIKALEVYIQPGLSKKDEKVAKVVIGSAPSDSYKEIQPELVSRIKKTLCEFYHLNDGQVSVSMLNKN